MEIKLSRKEKKLKRAKAIEYYQGRVAEIQSQLDNDPTLTDYQRADLSLQIKEFEGLVFDAKHPILGNYRKALTIANPLYPKARQDLIEKQVQEERAKKHEQEMITNIQQPNQLGDE